MLNLSNGSTRVFFAQYLPSTPIIPGPSIIVTPVSDTWNDFGNRFFAKLHLITASNELELSTDIRIMFEGISHTAAHLTKLFSENGWLIERNKIKDNFCSIILHEDSYRQIVSTLTLDEAIFALAQLGDAVVLEAAGTSDPRLNLIHSEQFHLGALRTPSAYSAWRHAKRHLRRDPPPPIEDASSNFSIKVQLPNLNSPYKIDFSFKNEGELLRNRIAVLIGRNGVGKTQLLLSMLKASLRFESTEQVPGALAKAEFIPEPSFNSLLVFSSVSSDPYPDSIPPWEGGIDYQYFSLIDRATQSPSRVNALTASLADIIRSGDLFELPDTPDSAQSRSGILQEALGDHIKYESIYLPLSTEISAGSNRITTILDGKYTPIHPIGGEGRTLEVIRRLDWTQPPAIIENGGLRRLSSGQLAMLRFAVQATGSIQKGSLILMDEPETHLHPNFISQFVQILHKILDATRSCAIIATHSAYIVREVPRSRVFVLRTEEGNGEVCQPRLQTFGASIDSISQFVFGDTEIKHLYEQLLSKWLGGETNIESVLEKHGSELNPESLSYIRQIINRGHQ